MTDEEFDAALATLLNPEGRALLAAFKEKQTHIKTPPATPPDFITCEMAHFTWNCNL